MKLETVALDDQQTKLIAEFDSDTLEKYKRQAARKISQNQKFPGFRPGKAPYDLVRRVIGEEAIQQEAIELMLDDVYPQVLKEANVNPSGPGKLEEIVKMDPPTFAFVVPLPPQVELGEYKEIRKEYAPEPITDEQVETTIRRLQRSYATAEPVNRPAQEGDMVSFKVSAKRTQPAEDEKETLIEETPYQMVAGEENDDENGANWPYEGFSKELIGLGENDTKTFTHTFVEESPFEDLRGKEAEFTVTVQGVKEMHLTELNDEFAQSLGEFENVEALRKAVRSQLEQNYSQQYDQDYYDALIKSLVDQATIKYPPHMLDEEVDEFMEGLEKNLQRDHLDLETYLKMREMDRETFITNEVKEAATRRLERSLVMEEFARRENIEVNSEEIRSIYYSALQQMQQSQPTRKSQPKKRSTQEMANSLAMNAVNSIFNQRLTSRLKAIATGKGDEEAQQPEVMIPSATDWLKPKAEQTEEQAQAEAPAEPEDRIPTESQAALESVESSAAGSEPEAEQEQAAGEADVLAQEPPQGDTEPGDIKPEESEG